MPRHVFFVTLTSITLRLILYATLMTDDTEHIQNLLAENRDSLRKIERQIAQQGGEITAPLPLLKHRDNLRAEIERLEMQLHSAQATAGAGRGRLTAVAPDDRRFVGRVTGLHRVLECVRNGHRRCTAIYGMGGMGKTALAEAAGRALLGDDPFPNGVWKVELRNIASVADARVATVVALGLSTPAAADNVALAAALTEWRALLILDDLDVLQREDAAGLRGLLSALLAAPSLRLLLTSRPRLYESQQQSIDLERVSDDDTLALFAEYNATLPEATGWTPAQRQQLLDALHGYPFAIRLAATLAERDEWPLDKLLRTLRERTASAFRLPGAQGDREASLEATLDLSYATLDAAEQAAFAALALFPAGLDEEAAEAILGAGAADALAGLRRASMAERRSADGRYRLPEPARDYAERKQPSDLRNQHGPTMLDYYADLVERCNDLIVQGKIEVGRDRLSAELPNIYATLDWGYDHEQPQNNMSRSARATLNLDNYWTFIGTREQDSTLQRLARALKSAHCSEDRWGAVNMFQTINDVRQRRDENDDVLTSQQFELELRRAVNDRFGEANILSHIGDEQQFRADYNGALESYQSALEIYRAIGARRGEAITLAALSRLQIDVDPAQSQVLLGEALALSRAIGDKYSEAANNFNYGLALFNRDRGMNALPYFQRARELYIKCQLDDRVARIEGLIARIEAQNDAA